MESLCWLLFKISNARARYYWDSARIPDFMDE
jgi:hypothetical protein